MTSTPGLTVPAGACDSHIHIYGGPEHFAYVPYAGVAKPAHFLDEYLQVHRKLGLSRAVIVQTPLYETDNACVLDNIARMRAIPGADCARGIAIVPAQVSDAELQRLHGGGVCGLRFGIELHKGLDPKYLESIAERIAPLDWHIQYRSTYDDLPALAQRLGVLPVPVCIDHFGSTDPSHPLGHPAFRALLDLLAGGQCWVKLSAPYQLSRSGASGYEDFLEQARALVAAAPQRMLWGTNWPHPKVDWHPDEASLLDVLQQWCPDMQTVKAILVDNPARLYDFVDSGFAASD
jgi:predicted TIM-barrel fold metal-dependent hydrolase